MAEQWLTLEDAAKRVERSPRTIRRWTRPGGPLRARSGRVIESQLLEVDRVMRARVGRPKGTTVPIVLNGREVGRITIGPDGEISGRMKP